MRGVPPRKPPTAPASPIGNLAPTSIASIWKEQRPPTFLGSGGTVTDCNYFTQGEYADGGVVGGDPTKPLLNALNGYEATAQNFMPHFLPSPVSPFLPVLSYVSRNILNY